MNNPKNIYILKIKLPLQRFLQRCIGVTSADAYEFEKFKYSVNEKLECARSPTAMRGDINKILDRLDELEKKRL